MRGRQKLRGTNSSSRGTRCRCGGTAQKTVPYCHQSGDTTASSPCMKCASHGASHSLEGLVSGALPAVIWNTKTFSVFPLAVSAPKTAAHNPHMPQRSRLGLTVRLVPPSHRVNMTVERVGECGKGGRRTGVCGWERGPSAPLESEPHPADRLHRCGNVKSLTLLHQHMGALRLWMRPARSAAGPLAVPFLPLNTARWLSTQCQPRLRLLAGQQSLISIWKTGTRG